MPDELFKSATVPPASGANEPLPRRPRKSSARLTPEQAQRLDHFIRQQEVTGLTDAAIAEIIGTSRQTIGIHKRRQEALNRKEEAPRKQLIHSTDRMPLPASIQPATKAEIDRVNEADEPLSGEQSLRLLSYIARSSPNANAQVAALRALEVLRVQIEAPSRLGPPDPLTEDEQVDRLSLILEAVGYNVLNRAINKVWPTKT